MEAAGAGDSGAGGPDGGVEQRCRDGAAGGGGDAGTDTALAGGGDGEVVMGVLCGWSSSGGSCSKGPGGGGTPGHQRAPFASYSLSANQLGDDGLRRLLECLPQVPICSSLE